MGETQQLPAEIGEVIGGYKLVSILGQGGMGSVYLAEHALLGRRAAVKVLASNLAYDDDYVSRFFHEAKIVNDVRHPNIVDIIDFVQTEEPKRVAYLMECLDGPALSGAIRENRFSVRQAVNITHQIAIALQAVHAVGVVHRDLKPDNIIVVGDLSTDLSEKASVKVLDFGIAKVADPEAKHHTATGTMMGTPAYMAPEQVSGLAVSPATDIYALAEIFFELVSGRRVFRGDNMVMFKQKLIGEMPDLELPDDVIAADEIIALTKACLQPELDARPELDQILLALNSILQKQPLTTGVVGPPLAVASQEVDTAMTPMAFVTSSELVAPPKRKIGLKAAGGGLLGFAAVITAITVGSQSAPEVKIEPAEVTPPAPAAAPAKAAEAEPAMVAVSVSSRPQKASIFDAETNRHLGFTPAEIILKGPKKRRVILKLAGHKDQPVDLVSTQSEYHYALTPIERTNRSNGPEARGQDAARLEKQRRRAARRARRRAQREAQRPAAAPSRPAPVRTAPAKKKSENSPLKKSEMPTW